MVRRLSQHRQSQKRRQLAVLCLGTQQTWTAWSRQLWWVQLSGIELVVSRQEYCWGGSRNKLHYCSYRVRIAVWLWSQRIFPVGSRKRLCLLIRRWRNTWNQREKLACAKDGYHKLGKGSSKDNWTISKHHGYVGTWRRQVNWGRDQQSDQPWWK